MGLFTSSKPSVTRKEFDRILADIYGRFPQETRQRLKALTAGYIEEHGSQYGMDASELKQFIAAARIMVPDGYESALKELEQRLEKAVKGSYGGV